MPGGVNISSQFGQRWRGMEMAKSLPVHYPAGFETFVIPSRKHGPGYLLETGMASRYFLNQCQL